MGSNLFFKNSFFAAEGVTSKVPEQVLQPPPFFIDPKVGDDVTPHFLCLAFHRILVLPGYLPIGSNPAFL
jgi:hypothetical protein